MSFGPHRSWMLALALCLGCPTPGGHADVEPAAPNEHTTQPPATIAPLSTGEASPRTDLLEAIQAHAAAAGHPICYDPLRYPHWLNDLNGDGRCDQREARQDNAYDTWTPALLQASSVYQRDESADAAIAEALATLARRP